MEDRAEYHTRHPQSDKQNTDRATQVEEVRRSRPTTTQDITVRQTECRQAQADRLALWVDYHAGHPQSDKQNADREAKADKAGGGLPHVALVVGVERTASRAAEGLGKLWHVGHGPQHPETSSVVHTVSTSKSHSLAWSYC